MGLISRVSSRTYRYIFNHADFRENSHWKNHHPRGRAIRHHRECQVQDPGQRRYPARSTTIDFRWQTTRRRTNLVRLQHPEGVHPSFGSSTPRWCHRAKFEAFGPEDQRQQVDLPKVLRQVEPKGHQLQEAKVWTIQRFATKEATRISNGLMSFSKSRYFEK